MRPSVRRARPSTRRRGVERYGRADDPDNGALGFPASFSSTLAVASVNEQEILGAITYGDHLIGYRPVTRMGKGRRTGI